MTEHIKPSVKNPNRSNVLNHYGISYILVPSDDWSTEVQEYDVLMATETTNSYIFTGFRKTGYTVTVEPIDKKVTVYTDRTDMPYGLALALALMACPQYDVEFRDNVLGYSKTDLDNPATATYTDMVPVEYLFTLLPIEQDM